MTTPFALGRIPEFDEKSKAYNIRALLDEPLPRSYTWACTYNLDQGQDGACVGFSWAHELGAKPRIHPVDYVTGMDIYHDAQKVDEWPGENYDGTSVLAGAKTVTSMGFLTEYRWALNVTDALAAISRRGPAVIGINWYDDMFTPDANGFLHPTGGVAGEHAILVRGVNVPARTVLLHNSWGPAWGGTKWGPGTALLSWDDFEFLLHDNGECCIPVRRK